MARCRAACYVMLLSVVLLRALCFVSDVGMFLLHAAVAAYCVDFAVRILSSARSANRLVRLDKLISLNF